MKKINKYFAAILISLSISGAMTGCGTNTDIGRDEATRIALEDAGLSESDVFHLSVSKETDDGKAHYDVEFANDSAEYDYEILASNGEIISYKVEKNNAGLTQPSQPITDNNNQAQTNSNDNNQTQTNPDDNSQTQANPDGNSQTQANSDNSSQTQTNPDGNSQTQTNPNDNIQTQTNSTGTQLTLEEAKKLALDKVPGATDQNIAIEFEIDDGYYLYEGEIIYNQKEYEFEIDAVTGAFLEWSEEQIYYHHNEHDNHNNHH